MCSTNNYVVCLKRCFDNGSPTMRRMARAAAAQPRRRSCGGRRVRSSSCSPSCGRRRRRCVFNARSMQRQCHGYDRSVENLCPKACFCHANAASAEWPNATWDDCDRPCSSPAILSHHTMQVVELASWLTSNARLLMEVKDCKSKYCPSVGPQQVTMPFSIL